MAEFIYIYIYICSSFGPTTAGRMDAYVDLFQKHGGSMIMYVLYNAWQFVIDLCGLCLARTVYTLLFCGVLQVGKG